MLGYGKLNNGNRNFSLFRLQYKSKFCSASLNQVAVAFCWMFLLELLESFNLFIAIGKVFSSVKYYFTSNDGTFFFFTFIYLYERIAFYLQAKAVALTFRDMK